MIEARELEGLPIRPLRREEYDRLVELDVFDADERVELLCGRLVAMSPQKPPQAWVLSFLPSLLDRSLGDRALVRNQLPLALSEDSEPEPDIAVVPLGDYRAAHPTQAMLIVEVADASVRKDRILKARLYADAGVPEYWLVDLTHGEVIVHRAPGSTGYGEIVTHRDGELRLSAFPDVAVALDRLLGKTL